MTTATIPHSNTAVHSKAGPAEFSKWYFALLAVAFSFFAAHGVFSFQLGHSVGGGFSPGTVVPREQGILGQFVFPAIAYLISLSLIVRSGGVALAMRFRVFTVLALVTLTSAIWSQDPLRSAVNGGLYLIDTLFAYAIVTRLRAGQVMTLTCIAGTLIACISMLLVVWFPAYGIALSTRLGVEWRGIFIDKNAAAKALVFLLSPALTQRRSRSRLWIVLYVALLLIFIINTQSITGRVVLLIYVGFLAAFAIFKRLGSRGTLAIAILIGLLSIPLAAVVLDNLSAILSAIGRDPTLSGRTVIWGALLQSILKRPLLGYGYYSFWLGLHGESGRIIHTTNWTFGYAHNGFIEIALQLGVVGVALFLLTLVRAIRDAWICIRLGEYDEPLWYIGLIVLTLVYNIDEVTVLLPHDLLSMLYIIACCGLSCSAAKALTDASIRGNSIDLSPSGRAGSIL